MKKRMKEIFAYGLKFMLTLTKMQSNIISCEQILKSEAGRF